MDITLEAPSPVDSGTRFEVSWTGTPGEGDYVAVARANADAARHLDWAFATLGSPLSLAAPFEPGQYVVRFISGSSREVIAQVPIQVR